MVSLPFHLMTKVNNIGRRRMSTHLPIVQVKTNNPGPIPIPKRSMESIRRMVVQTRKLEK